MLTVAAAVATGGGEAKISGDEEEGGEKATSPSMFGSLASSMTSATSAASSLFTSVGNTISGTNETASATGTDESSAGGFFRKKPKNPPKKDAAPSRELEIIRFVVAGLTTEAIAETLYLSPHTVHTHRRNVLTKLGLHSTAELVKWAYENKMV